MWAPLGPTKGVRENLEVPECSPGAVLDSVPAPRVSAGRECPTSPGARAGQGSWACLTWCSEPQGCWCDPRDSGPGPLLIAEPPPLCPSASPLPCRVAWGCRSRSRSTPVHELGVVHQCASYWPRAGSSCGAVSPELSGRALAAMTTGEAVSRFRVWGAPQLQRPGEGGQGAGHCAP